MKIGRWSSVTNKRCAAKNFLPQVMWKYHCLVTVSWTEAFCVAGRLALVVLMFAFRHRFVRLWHEFCRLWRQFVQEAPVGDKTWNIGTAMALGYYVFDPGPPFDFDLGFVAEML